MKAIDILHKITPEIMERINSILDNKPAVAVSSTPLCPYPVLTPQSRAMVEGARLGRSSKAVPSCPDRAEMLAGCMLFAD